MIDKTSILNATHKGFTIFKRVLSYYYEDSLLLGLSGQQCLPAQNPFNSGEPSLRISLQDGVYCYADYKLPDFKGDAFDFAFLHYQLEGQDLLEKINQDLNLNLRGEDEKGREGEDEKGREGGREKGREGEDEKGGKGFVPILVLEMPQFSFYRAPITNTKPEREVNLLEVFNLVVGDTYKAITEELRSITDPEAASIYKRKNFAYMTVSGVFSKRSDAALVSHSGLLTLDFDHVDNISRVMDDLKEDPDLLSDMMFRSPSGHGFKSIVSIDVMKYSHRKWFETVARYLKKRHNLELDRSGKDVSRACFLCHDPDAWIHPLYLI
jgi:hypothetical protein